MVEAESCQQYRSGWLFKMAAGAAGGFECFLAVHGVKGEETAFKPKGRDQSLSCWDLIAFVIDRQMPRDDRLVLGKDT